jgi:WD40 repeat protein
MSEREGPLIDRPPSAAVIRPFESLSELRQAHEDLIAVLDGELQHDASADAEHAALARLEREAQTFIGRSAATGVFLESVADRTAAAVLLDYWVSALARAGHSTAALRLQRFDAAQLPDLKDKPCPFKGLDAFSQNDEKFFFGRGADIDALTERILEQPLVIVSGASGSGKSSLVMSGALPALAKTNRFVLLDVIRPGDAVLDHLAAAAQPGVRNPEAGDRLRADPSRLLAWLSAAGTRPAVITIDQFEEVFTLASDDDRRALGSCLAAVLAPNTHRVVLTIRQEFQTRVVGFEPLRPYLDDKAWYSMRPMGYDGLRAAIDGPSALVNLHVQPDVADALVKSVLGQPAALPLLQFTLRALWDTRDRNRITREVYARVGDPLSALKSSADRFFDAQPVEAQDEVKRILLALVRVDELLEAYRQPVRRSSLVAAGRANTQQVLQLLIDNDYVRTSPGVDDDPLVEVKHESLIRNWPRYVGWIDDKRLERRRRLALTEAASAWVGDRRRERLLTGWQLEEAKQYHDLSSTERAFVGASSEEEDDRIRLKNRARNRLFAGTAVAAVGFLLMAVTLLLLWQQSQKASQRAAFLAELTGARFMAERDPAAGLAGIGIALKRHPWIAQDSDLRSVVFRSISSIPDTVLTRTRVEQPNIVSAFVLQKKSDTASPAAIVSYSRQDVHFWTPSGRRIAFTSTGSANDQIALVGPDASGLNAVVVWRSGRIVWFDAAGQLIREARAPDVVSRAILAPVSGRVFTAFNPGQDAPGYVAGIDADGTPIRRFAESNGSIDIVTNPSGTRVITLQGEVMRLWDAASGRQMPCPFSPRSGTSGVPPVRVKKALFGPDNTSILVVDSDGRVRVWRRPTAPPSEILGQPVVMNASINAAGQVATVSTDGAIRIIEPDGQESAVWRSNADSVSFSDDGGYLLTWVQNSGPASAADGQTSVNVWNLDGERVGVLRGHSQVVTSAEFATGGHLIVTASTGDGTARLWDLDGRLGANLRSHYGEFARLSFSRDSTHLATIDGAAVRIWDRRFASSRDLTGDQGPILDVQFSPDGQRVGTVLLDGTARIWTVATGQSITLAVDKAEIYRVAFSFDSQRVLTTSSDGVVQLWDLQGAQVLRLDRSPQIDAFFMPNARQILTVGKDGAQLWDSTGQPMASLAGQFTTLTIAPDGQRILTADAGGIRLWDTRGRSLLEARMANVVTAAFAMNGTRLFVATSDGPITLLDLNGNPVSTIKQTAPLGAQLSPEGHLILIPGADKQLRLWNWAGQLLATIAGDMASFSPDDQLLATVLRETNTPRVWPISIASYISRLDQLDLPCLSATQLDEGLLLGDVEAGRLNRECLARVQTGAGR